MFPVADSVSNLFHYLGAFLVVELQLCEGLIDTHPSDLERTSDGKDVWDFLCKCNYSQTPSSILFENALVYLIKSSIISIICQQHHGSWRIALTVQTSISPFLPGTTSCLCYTWSAFCCGGPPAAEKEAQVKDNVETCRHAILEGLNVVVNHIFNHKKDSLLASLVPPPAEEDTLSSSSSPSSYLPEKHWCGDMRAAEDQQAIVTCRNMEKEMRVCTLVKLNLLSFLLKTSNELEAAHIHKYFW